MISKIILPLLRTLFVISIVVGVIISSVYLGIYIDRNPNFLEKSISFVATHVVETHGRFQNKLTQVIQSLDLADLERIGYFEKLKSELVTLHNTSYSTIKGFVQIEQISKLRIATNDHILQLKQSFVDLADEYRDYIGGFMDQYKDASIEKWRKIVSVIQDIRLSDKFPDLSYGDHDSEFLQIKGMLANFIRIHNVKMLEINKDLFELKQNMKKRSFVDTDLFALLRERWEGYEGTIAEAVHPITEIFPIFERVVIEFIYCILSSIYMLMVLCIDPHFRHLVCFNLVIISFNELVGFLYAALICGITFNTSKLKTRLWEYHSAVATLNDIYFIRVVKISNIVLFVYRIFTIWTGYFYFLQDWNLLYIETVVIFVCVILYFRKTAHNTVIRVEVHAEIEMKMSQSQGSTFGKQILTDKLMVLSNSDKKFNLGVTLLMFSGWTGFSNPFEGLEPPIWKKRILFLLTIVPFIIADVIMTDIVLISLWFIKYAWLYPRLWNKTVRPDILDYIRMSMVPTNIFFRGEVLREVDDYTYNVVRFWALVWGWYRPDEVYEPVYFHLPRWLAGIIGNDAFDMFEHKLNSNLALVWNLIRSFTFILLDGLFTIPSLIVYSARAYIALFKRCCCRETDNNIFPLEPISRDTDESLEDYTDDESGPSPTPSPPPERIRVEPLRGQPPVVRNIIGIPVPNTVIIPSTNLPVSPVVTPSLPAIQVIPGFAQRFVDQTIIPPRGVPPIPAQVEPVTPALQQDPLPESTMNTQAVQAPLQVASTVVSSPQIPRAISIEMPPPSCLLYVPGYPNLRYLTDLNDIYDHYGWCVAYCDQERLAQRVPDQSATRYIVHFQTRFGTKLHPPMVNPIPVKGDDLDLYYRQCLRYVNICHSNRTNPDAGVLVYIGQYDLLMHARPRKLEVRKPTPHVIVPVDLRPDLPSISRERVHEHYQLCKVYRAWLEENGQFLDPDTNLFLDQYAYIHGTRPIVYHNPVPSPSLFGDEYYNACVTYVQRAAQYNMPIDTYIEEFIIEHNSFEIPEPPIPPPVVVVAASKINLKTVTNIVIDQRYLDDLSRLVSDKMLHEAELEQEVVDHVAKLLFKMKGAVDIYLSYIYRPPPPPPPPPSISHRPLPYLACPFQQILEGGLHKSIVERIIQFDTNLSQARMARVNKSLYESEQETEELIWSLDFTKPVQPRYPLYRDVPTKAYYRQCARYCMYCDENGLAVPKAIRHAGDLGAALLSKEKKKEPPPPPPRTLTRADFPILSDPASWNVVISRLAENPRMELSKYLNVPLNLITDQDLSYAVDITESLYEFRYIGCLTRPDKPVSRPKHETNYVLYAMLIVLEKYEVSLNAYLCHSHYRGFLHLKPASSIPEWNMMGYELSCKFQRHRGAIMTMVASLGRDVFDRALPVIRQTAFNLFYQDTRDMEIFKHHLNYLSHFSHATVRRYIFAISVCRTDDEIASVYSDTIEWARRTKQHKLKSMPKLYGTIRTLIKEKFTDPFVLATVQTKFSILYNEIVAQELNDFEAYDKMNVEWARTLSFYRLDVIEGEDAVNQPLTELAVSYHNMELIKLEHSDADSYGGLKILGCYTRWHQKPIKIYVDEALRQHIKYRYPAVDCEAYHVSSSSKQLLEQAFSKYTIRCKLDDYHSSYSGLTFKGWAFRQLDSLFGWAEGETTKIEPVEMFTADKYLKHTAKRFPGLATRASGIPNKGTNLDLTKAWARQLRDEIIRTNSIRDHYWATICVPKTCKKGRDGLRIVAAPEMPFYILQTLLFEPFVSKARNCKATNDFQPFFLGFNYMVNKLKVEGHVIQTVDLTDMGGRVPPLAFDLFYEWYYKKLENHRDQQVFGVILDEIRNAKMVLPTWAGSHVVQTQQGWKDGPYGTTFVDAWFSILYYLYGLWLNVIRLGPVANLAVIPLRMIETVKMEVHGDNIAMSYPLQFDRWLSWRTMETAMNDLGQQIKEIQSSSDPVAHEIMGFKIKKVQGNHGNVYVGYRDPEKTVKSLVFREHHYETQEKENSYILAICQCLNIIDCWNDTAWAIVNDTMVMRKGNEPIIRTDFQAKANELERYRKNRDPRSFYWLTPQAEAVPFDWEDMEPENK